MSDYAATGLKPSEWPDRGEDFEEDWLHSDIRNMAYIYTRLVFDYLATDIWARGYQR